MNYIDRDKKNYVIYMDAEFQTFRSIKEGDKFATVGFVATPPYIYKHNDKIYNKYQFLLNLAFIIIDESNNRYYFTIVFPSLFQMQPIFDDGIILEPGYTVASAKTIREMTANRTKSVPKFSFFKDIKTVEGIAEFHKMNNLYKADYTPQKEEAALNTLVPFITIYSPNSKLIHKGHTDIDAIYNTCKYYGLSTPTLNTRNLNSFDLSYGNTMGYTGGRDLESLHTLFVERDPEIRKIRDSILDEATEFLKGIYGDDGVVRAHNPLIDSVYTLIVDIGIKKYFGPKLTLKR